MSSSNDRRILVVDDESSVRDSVQRMLQADGHRVEIASSSSEALALLQKTAFDLVLTDYEMPGMKGDKLAAVIHMFFPALPVVLITAYGAQVRSGSQPLQGIRRILAKPFELAELRQTVEEVTVGR